MHDDESPATAYFNAELSARYDKKIRASIPGYEAMHAMAHDLLRIGLPPEAEVLVVGAGTGMELVTLGRANPGWRFTAVDPSEEMLAHCRHNVAAAGLAARVTIVAGRVDELPARRTFDAATAMLVSHFIPDHAKRQAFFTAIADRLKAKGVLVTADLAGEPATPAFDQFLRAWKEHYTLAGTPPAEVEEDFQRSMQSVTYLPAEAVEALLTTGGFTDLRLFYRALLFHAWTGTLLPAGEA